MSQVYSTEPATSGHVILDTTHGPIDIHLWCKECPTTTRTFVQLCLDGYYDGMIFHRILSDFLMQTGLTTDGKTLMNSSSNSSGGAVGISSYNAAAIDTYLRSSSAAASSTNSLGVGGGGGGDALLGLDRKKLEVNPRIRFNHRGQVAMAFPLEEISDAQRNDDEETAMLRYQFFVTLDEAPFLDAKHVLFGTVAGPTMFNALRIGRTDSDEKSGIPMDVLDDPPRIKSVKVNYHPFEDLVVSSDDKIPWKKKTVTGGGEGKQQSAMEIQRKKRKGKRDYNVLSFGDEEREYEEAITTTTDDDGKSGHQKKTSVALLSSHDDVLSNSRNAGVQDFKVNDDSDNADGKNSEHDHEVKVERNGIELTGRKEMNGSDSKRHYSEISPGLEKNVALDNSISHNQKQKKGDSIKSGGLSAVEARRAKYLKSGSGSSANKKERLKREGDTLARLSAFKNKVIKTMKGQDSLDNQDTEAPKFHLDDSLATRMAERAMQKKEEEDLRRKEEDEFKSLPGYSGQVVDEVKSGFDNSTWMGTKFKCRRHMDNDSRLTVMDNINDDRIGGDGRMMEDYVVLDEKKRQIIGRR